MGNNPELLNMELNMGKVVCLHSAVLATVSGPEVLSGEQSSVLLVNVSRAQSGFALVPCGCPSFSGSEAT